MAIILVFKSSEKVIYPIRSAIINWVSISANDPEAIFKNLIKSFVEPLLAPSEIFEGNETAALLNCDVSPKFSEEGKPLVILY